MANTFAGIDVSHYQGTVNWKSVWGAGVYFAFAKATEGTSVVDSQFKINWTGMKNAGLIRGAYHFFHPSQDATAQANFYLQTVGFALGDLPPVLDVEDADTASNSAIVSGVQTWLDVVFEGTGRIPMIYTAPSFWNEHLNNQFGSYPLWVANYGVQSPSLPTGWTTWAFWQYSQSGSISGVTGPVDQDWFNGDDFAHFLIWDPPGPFPKSVPPPPPPGQPSAGGGSASTTYTVQAGDTLSKIANQFGVTVNSLVQANNIQDPNLIQVGQVLQIP